MNQAIDIPHFQDFSPALKGTIETIRNAITIAMGCIKELKSQAVEKYDAPGMRIMIGEIIGCLGSAKALIDRSMIPVKR